MNALKLYRQWDERRALKWAGWWERKRSHGKKRFVRVEALSWSGIMINVKVLTEVFLSGGFSFEKFLYTLPLYLVGGWLMGLWMWSSNEKRYQKYLTGGPERQLRQ